MQSTEFILAHMHATQKNYLVKSENPASFRISTKISYDSKYFGNQQPPWEVKIMKEKVHAVACSDHLFKVEITQRNAFDSS